MKKLGVFINGQLVFDYDRKTELVDEQQAFLDRMDGDMARGIKIQGELIAEPDLSQRARFVALNLIKALKQENDAAIAVSCAYLVKRMPGLVELHANDSDNGIVIEMIEEQAARS